MRTARSGTRFTPGVLPLLLALTLAPEDCPAEPLVADMSAHLVAITTGFNGADLVLFGVTDGPGDIVVVVRGPPSSEVVHRKERVNGVWVNTERVAFQGVPSFYRIAATRPLTDIGPDDVMRRHGLGLGNLEFDAEGGGAIPRLPAFRDALVRLKQAVGLYGAVVEPVTVLDNNLFRADVHLPANVPKGRYAVEIYLLRDRRVVDRKTSPLSVTEIGAAARVYSLAHDAAPLYGTIAIAVAVVGGWLAAVAFGRH